MDSWSRGRVTLCGDAGYCASPLCGMGTSLALVGAYLLAGELGPAPDALSSEHLDGALASVRPTDAALRRQVPGPAHRASTATHRSPTPTSRSPRR